MQNFLIPAVIEQTGRGERSYDILIGSGLLGDAASWAGLPASADALIVTCPLPQTFSLLVSAEVDATQYRAVGTALARIFLVQIFFYGLNALASALLNARRRFFAAAWVPAISNVVIIASLLLVPKVTDGALPTPYSPLRFM